MRILVVSDTHRHDELCLALLEHRGPFDMFIHCGDVEGSETKLSLAANCECHMVTGNNDFFSCLPRETEFMMGNYKAFLTHGHTYHCSFELEYLKQEAISRGANIVFYGHTHKSVAKWDSGILFINPGSISFPRQEGRRQSYVLMEINEKSELSYEICYI